MKFYNREKEIVTIDEIVKRSKKKGQLIVLQGRRRIGKTFLMLNYFQNKKFLYFFVGRKSERELLVDFREEILQKLDLPYLGEFKSISDLFKFLFSYSKKKHLNVVFDEFQNFKYVNKATFSDLQKHWDLNKETSKISIFCIGSMFTLIKRIFTSSKEPLYNRASKIIHLKAFNLKVQKQILKDFKLFNPTNPKDFLIFFSFLAGIPKYFELIEDNNLQNTNAKKVIKKLFCEEDAHLQEEGKNVLIEEFGKHYDKYFSILTAISTGKTTKNEIYNYTGININSLGFFLKTLEEFYELIERRIPVLEKKTSSKLSRYKIKDQFLNFWFRFVYKEGHLIEIKNWSMFFAYIDAHLNQYLGLVFEDLIKKYLIESNGLERGIFNFDVIGSYWRRKSVEGDNSEIDIVAINNDKKTVLIGECKLSEKKITQKQIDNFIEKSNALKRVKKYEKIFYFFTVENISKNKQMLLKKNNCKYLSLETIFKKYL